MSTDLGSPLIPGSVVAGLRRDLAALRGRWLGFVVLGIALIVMGVIALSAVVIASIAATIALGVIFLVGGAFEIGGAFWARGWDRCLLQLLSGVLGIVVGILFLRAPVDALISLTLLIAFFLLAEGIFKIVASLVYRFPYWGWMLLSGAIDLLLGLLIWAQWPWSGFWVIGLFVGISLIFRGVDWLMVGLGLRALPAPTA